MTSTALTVYKPKQSTLLIIDDCSDKFYCNICMEEKYESYKHTCKMCKQSICCICSSKLVSFKCPFCRANYDSVANIYKIFRNPGIIDPVGHLNIGRNREFSHETNESNGNSYRLTTFVPINNDAYFRNYIHDRLFDLNFGFYVLSNLRYL